MDARAHLVADDGRQDVHVGVEALDGSHRRRAQPRGGRGPLFGSRLPARGPPRRPLCQKQQQPQHQRLVTLVLVDGRRARHPLARRRARSLRVATVVLPVDAAWRVDTGGSAAVGLFRPRRSEQLATVRLEAGQLACRPRARRPLAPGLPVAPRSEARRAAGVVRQRGALGGYPHPIVRAVSRPTLRQVVAPRSDDHLKALEAVELWRTRAVVSRLGGTPPVEEA